MVNLLLATFKNLFLQNHGNNCNKTQNMVERSILHLFVGGLGQRKFLIINNSFAEYRVSDVIGLKFSFNSCNEYLLYMYIKSGENFISMFFGIHFVLYSVNRIVNR